MKMHKACVSGLYGRRRMSMVVEKIYFDMDGVLADFDGGVVKLCNARPVDQMHHTPEDDDRLWESIRKVDHFYDRLEILDGSDVMLRTLLERYGERCEILTGIPKPRRGIKDAGDDKRKWMARNFGPEIKVNVVYRDQKKNYCTGEGCILIDDYKRNIDIWEEYGGTGILFTDAWSVMKKLQDMGIL